MMLEYFGCDSKSTLVNRAHNRLMGAVENDRKHDDLCVWEPLILVPMAHKELASKHGMHRMLLEDGSMQRNDLDTPTSCNRFKQKVPWHLGSYFYTNSK